MVGALVGGLLGAFDGVLLGALVGLELVNLIEQFFVWVWKEGNLRP